MQKNLIALAVGATIAAAPIVATQADVKLWGRLEVELVNTDGGKYDSQLQQGDDNGMSRIGVDASKDLGNGLKAIGRYAFQLDPSNGDQFKARDQWVGLKGGWGNVKFGRQPTSYKMYGGVKWDPFVATFLQARRAGAMSGDTTGHNGFQNDIMKYNSPKFGAFKFSAEYIADEVDNGGQNGSAGIGASGVFGPVEIIGAFLNINKSGEDDTKQGKLGIRYKANNLTAALQYESVDEAGSIKANGNAVAMPNGSKTVGEADIIFVNLGYKFGNTLLTGTYGNTDAEDSANDVKNAMIGARYYFAKKVSAYLGYSEIKTDTKYKMFGAGMRYDF